MFGTNMDLLQDFHTSVVSQTVPENSPIFEVIEGMLGICNKILVPRKCAHVPSDILDHCLKSAVDRNCTLGKSSKK